MSLRPYQEKMLADLRAAYREGFRAPLLTCATGSGKSFLIAHMAERTKKKTLLLAHRIEIVKQLSEAMTVKHGIIAPGFPATDAQVQIGSMQTVARRLDRLPDFEWVISDEAHISACATWSSIINHYKNSWHLGTSATPTRSDGRGLDMHFDKLVAGPGIGSLISQGYLCPLRTFVPAAAVGKIKVARGDYVMKDAAREYDKRSITGDAIAQYVKHACGRRALVFCCGIAHAEHVAEQFKIAGFQAINVDGTMTREERNQRIKDFRSGALQVLTSSDLLTTGFDCPEIECGVMLRPTQSLALFIQMAGRILRIADGKTEAILLDHAGNTLVHGMADEDRDWTLLGSDHSKKGAKDNGPVVRMCKKCFAAIRPGPPSCPYCGSVFIVEPRKLNEVDGELEEYRAKQKKIQARQEQTQAQTLEELHQLGIVRGYKNPLGWAQYIFDARAAKRAKRWS